MNTDNKAFYELVQASQEQILSGLRYVVAEWAKREIAAGHQAFMFERFIEEFPEWSKSPLHETIKDEMNRVSELCRREGK